MDEHNPVKVFLIVITFLAQTVMVAINLQSHFPSESMGLFTKKNGTESRNYYLEIIPHDTTFFIWDIVYCWETFWLIYVFTTLFQKCSRGPLYVYPPVAPGILFNIYILTCILNSIWLVLFDRKYYLSCAIILFFTFPMLFLGVILAHVRVDQFTDFMLKNELNKDLWCNRVLMLNALAMRATWGCIAFCLNMAIICVHEYKIDQNVISTQVLIMISVWTTLYSCIARKCKSARYTITPYLVVCWTTVGIIAKNLDFKCGKCNTVLSLCLLIGSGGVLFLKILGNFKNKEVRVVKQTRQFKIK